jgi:hypothetical protein
MEGSSLIIITINEGSRLSLIIIHEEARASNWIVEDSSLIIINEEAQARKRLSLSLLFLFKNLTWKIGWDRLAIPSFQNEFPAFDTRISWNSKLETQLGNLVKTKP